MDLKVDIRLQDNFWYNEFVFAGDVESPEVIHNYNIERLSQKLQMLRNILDVDFMFISSGFRGKTHNKNVGGSADSYHLQGLAADIVFDFTGWTRKSMIAVLSYCGFKNVNFYWNAKRDSWQWLHVDLGDTWDKSDFYVRDFDAKTKKVIKL